MADIQIVMPVGAMGRWEGDDALDTMLRNIGEAAASEGDRAEKYGAKVDNAVFAMHPYCWCERESCPWCSGCDCPEGSTHYFVDGVEVAFAEWMAFYEREAYEKPSGGRVKTLVDLLAANPNAKLRRALDLASETANKRRTETHDAVCDYCTGNGVFAGNGAEPGRGAPNFWHKPSGLKVWWYKYIGRGVEVVGPEPTPDLLAQVEAECLASLRSAA